MTEPRPRLVEVLGLTTCGDDPRPTEVVVRFHLDTSVSRVAFYRHLRAMIDVLNDQLDTKTLER